MEHTVQAEGYGVRMRPVRMADAEFIVWLRGLEHARGKVGDSAVNVAGQEAWLKSYFARPGDYYFIVETLGGRPVGAYGIYNMADGSAESGRWVIRPDVPAGIPSAILAFNMAFNHFKLRQVRVSTVSTNHRVLSLNAKFGCRQTRVEKDAQVIDGKPVDLVHFVLDPEEWAKRAVRLAPMARIAEAQVRRWEQLQLAAGNQACDDAEKTIS